MFDWWDTRTSLAIVGVLVAVRFIGQPLWARYIEWQLRVRHHIWCLPLFAVAGFTTGIIALSLQQIRLGEVLIIILFSAGSLLSLLIGARCPDCGVRIQYRHNKYGPLTYRCRQCGYMWTDWPLKDSLPD